MEVKEEILSTSGLEKDIETLDKEAREAMDNLVTRRDELRRQLRATEIAEQREREREEERRRQEAEEAERRRVEEAKNRYEELRKEDEMLREERDSLARRLKDILEEQAELSVEMQHALREYDPEASNNLAWSTVGFKKRWLRKTFKGELR